MVAVHVEHFELGGLRATEGLEKLAYLVGEVWGKGRGKGVSGGGGRGITWRGIRGRGEGHHEEGYQGEGEGITWRGIRGRGEESGEENLESLSKQVGSLSMDTCTCSSTTEEDQECVHETDVVLTEAAACPESGGLHRSCTTGASSVQEVKKSSSFAP